MRNKEQVRCAASIVHEMLCIQSNCFVGGKLQRCHYIVCVDDDPTSAIYAARLAKVHEQLYGFVPLILCVGGKGLMSRWTHKVSEGEHLAYVCHKLGYEAFTVILDHGTNTGANVLEVADYIGKNMPVIPPSVIFVATKRLSLRLALTVTKQAPKLDAYFYVIDEDIKQACKWYNGKKLGNNQMMYHELASILNRCEAYAGIYQDPIPFEIAETTRSAANLLASKYRLKLPHKNLRSMFQFLYLLIEIQRHKKAMAEDLEAAIQHELQQKEVII